MIHHNNIFHADRAMGPLKRHKIFKCIMHKTLPFFSDVKILEAFAVQKLFTVFSKKNTAFNFLCILRLSAVDIFFVDGVQYTSCW